MSTHLTATQVAALARAAGVPIPRQDMAEVTLRVNAFIVALSQAPEPSHDLVPFPVLTREEADDHPG